MIPRSTLISYRPPPARFEVRGSEVRGGRGVAAILVRGASRERQAKGVDMRR